jgi:uncharacterized protein (DUF433 family)
MIGQPRSKRMPKLSIAPELPITIDPEVVSGAPVFRGTRVPVQSLFDYIADGYTLDQFLEYFPSVNRQDATRVLELASDSLAQLASR